MSLNIPSNPAPTGYQQRPAEYTAALEKARALFDSHITDDGSWEVLPEKEDVKLARKNTSDEPGALPLTRGITTVESATPAQVLAAIQLPGIRVKWDPRFDQGHAIARYGPHTYEFYSLMKSPSYFVWARDIVGIQENFYSNGGDQIDIIQTTVTDEENLPEAGSYSKSRTRATVDISGWRIAKKGEDVELTYIVKVHLNGAIPTSVVSTIAAETPMCVGRVRDVYYSFGYHPYELNTSNGGSHDAKSVGVTQVFEDAKGQKQWIGSYRGVGADKIEIAYDAQRLYSSGVSASVEGEGASEVSASVDEDKHVVTVEVSDGAKDKDFQV
jgi:hypothetical protein